MYVVAFFVKKFFENADVSPFGFFRAALKKPNGETSAFSKYMYVLAVSLNYSSVFSKSTRKRTTNIDSGLKISRLWRLLGHQSWN